MLVKELRQGMRTRVFIAVFLSLQIFLGLILLSAGATASSDHAGTTISNIIFIFFAIAVLIIQPMRGIGSLSSEIKSNTIDMMVLTRLSAWKIVTGKWSAVVSQSALILVTIVPYLILRYFFGGMNLQGEIVLLALIFITSAALTSVTVGISASGSVILRSILPMLTLPIGSYILLMFLMFGGGIKDLVEFCSLSSSESRVILSIYVATCAYIGFFFLSAGTSLIAPYAENHSTLRRLVALVATLVATGLSFFPLTNPDVLPLIFTLIFAPVFATSLTEFAPLVPPTYHRFARRGVAGKAAGFFLFPGWSSGFFFCVLLAGIAAVAFIFNKPTYGGQSLMITALGCLGTLLFPAVLINLFKMQGPQRVSNYVLVGIASTVLSTVLYGIAEAMSNTGFLWLFVWMPPTLFSMQSSSHFDDSTVLGAAVLVNVLLLGTLLVFATRAYRESMAEMVRAAE
jgi:hypothetical protein